MVISISLVSFFSHLLVGSFSVSKSCCFPPYTFGCLCLYGITHILKIPWAIILHSHSVVPLFWFWPLEVPVFGSCVLLSRSLPPSFFEHFLTFQPPQDAQGSCWIFLAPALESATSPKSPVFSLIGEWHLETWVWVQDVLGCYWGIIVSRPS